MEKTDHKFKENSSKRSFQDDLFSCSQRIRTSKRARIDSDSEVCKKSFDSHSDMRRHQQNKHKNEDSTISCNDCGKRFGRMASLIDHQKAKHNDHRYSREKGDSDGRRKRNRSSKSLERSKLRSEAFFAKKKSEGDESKGDFCEYCYNQDVVQLGIGASKDETNSKTVEDEYDQSTLSFEGSPRDSNESTFMKEEEKEKLVDEAIAIAMNSSLMMNNEGKDSKSILINMMAQNETTKGKESDRNQNEITGGEVKVLECGSGDEMFGKNIVKLKHLHLLRYLMIHYGANNFSRT